MLNLTRLCAVSSAVMALMSGAIAQEGAVSDPQARGTTPNEQKGYDISARGDRTDLGFGDSMVEAQMVLRNAAGQESTRDLSFLRWKKKMKALAISRWSCFALHET